MQKPDLGTIYTEGTTKARKLGKSGKGRGSTKVLNIVHRWASGIYEVLKYSR